MIRAATRSIGNRGTNATYFGRNWSNRFAASRPTWARNGSRICQMALVEQSDCSTVGQIKCGELPTPNRSKNDTLPWRSVTSPLSHKFVSLYLALAYVKNSRKCPLELG